MDRSVYDNMRAIEKTHWWFRARRKIISAQIARLGLRQNANILEVGCGTGGNLQMLSIYGRVLGIEPDNDSRTYAAETSGFTVLGGLLPDGLPKFDEKFDLIAALDVIEHLEEDTKSIDTIKNLLKSGGIFLSTVPAHPWLWSRHDELHHHRRRYVKADYVAMMQEAGFEIVRSTYFNSVLFPAIVAARAAQSRTKSSASDDSMPSTFINRALEYLFASERVLLRFLNLPFGVSILVVARAVD